MIGLPLRLLAREVYDKVVAARRRRRRSRSSPARRRSSRSAPRYWVCTVEAMPLDLEVDFLAIDEIQLAADRERGHVFTDRLLHARGRSETLLLGAETMRDADPRARARRQSHLAAAPVEAHLRRREEDHPAAAALAPSSPSRPTRSTRSPS